MDMFKFPPTLPMMLHPCPQAERPNWIAELDLDPNMNGKISVCSLHFKEGRPTEKHPFPTELLRDTKQHPGYFKGQKINKSVPEDVYDGKFIQIVLKKRGKKRRNQRAKLGRKPKKDPLRSKSQKLLKRSILNGLGSKRWCNQCHLKYDRFRQFYNHFLVCHRPQRASSSMSLSSGNSEETGSKVEEKQTEATCKMKPAVVEPVLVTKEEEKRLLNMLYPLQEARTVDPKKKYVCAVCKSVCDLLGLFTHMKEVHQGVLCQYCLKLFKKVGDLELHLKNMHKVRSRFFHSAQEFLDKANPAFSIICSVCSKMVKAKDLASHPCGLQSKRTFDCPFCSRTFSFQNQLELHLCNGWCKGMTWLKQPSSQTSAKLYKVLTGIDLVKDYDNQMDKLVKQRKLPKAKSEFNVFSTANKALIAKEKESTKSIQGQEAEHMEGLPATGSILSGNESKGLNSHIKKEFKDTGYTFDLNVKLVELGYPSDENLKDIEITRAGKHFMVHNPKEVALKLEQDKREQEQQAIQQHATPQPTTPKSTLKLKMTPLATTSEKKETKKERRDRIVNEIYLNMQRIKETVDFFKESCLFCQQTTYVSVDTIFLLSHLHIIHQPDQVLNILKEDPEFCIDRIKKYLKEVKMRDIIFTYGVGQTYQFSGYKCCYCSQWHEASNYDRLFEHVAEEHKSKVLTCHLCQNIFLNYGSYVSHVCFGPPSGGQAPRAKFSCKTCGKQDLGTFLEFQLHHRKTHNLCEICLKVSSFVIILKRDKLNRYLMQPQGGQEELYHHCKAHSQELMCMRCLLTFDDLQQFSKHLFLKHEEEHKVCKLCHHKTWPHVYHFCLPKLDQPMSCEVCDVNFNGLKPYRVHLRLHTGANPYLCYASNCQRSYISRQLLWKHQVRNFTLNEANEMNRNFFVDSTTS